MIKKTKWSVSYVPDEKVEKLAKKAGVSSFLARIFLSRKIENEDHINDFLNPSLKNIYHPFLLLDMEKASDRILRAINDKEKILIYGDYDVDGITSTSILFDFLKRQNGNVDFYIPDRFEEGYGLSESAVKKIISKDIDLVITVDCGTTALEETELFTQNGIDVVITDHHECKDTIPEVYAVINPQRPDCNYPNKNLPGVGVAYKLIQALSNMMNIQSDMYLDLVTLGIIADVVPLTGENRALVKYGMSIINTTSNIGLRSLVEVSGVKDKEVTSTTVGYTIAPRINAAGRLGDAKRAVRLLTTDNETEALELAIELDRQNKERQDIEALIFEEVIEIIENDVDSKDSKIIIANGEGWHHGVIGIVASKISDKYNKPCILISTSYGIGKGSGRSIEGLNLFDGLKYCENVLDKYGGHELAAGLTIKEENIPEFKRLLKDYVDSCLDESHLIPKLKIDANITKDDITLENAKQINLLAPFGESNPEPLFQFTNAQISQIRTVGNDKHLKLTFSDGDYVINAIAFNKGDLINVFKESDIVDVACILDINRWNGDESVQLIIKDIKPACEILMKNMFFMSLDKSMELNNDKINSRIDNMFSMDKNIEQYLEDNISIGNNIAILINSLESLKGIYSMLEKFSFINDHKYSINFLTVDTKKKCKLHVLVNPCVEQLTLSIFDKIIIYGNWLSREYLCKVLDKIDCSNICVFDKVNFDFDKKDIIPDRREMAFLYKYLKTNYESTFVLESLFAFSDFISTKYGININYYKLKKIIQIFEELYFIKSIPYGKYGMSVEMLDTAKDKNSLENSVIYRRINLLK
ncbi:UNVERIFIED_CONTAM: single-stranded-DNA-specific exonuclease [Acetivibrio alkalicellulosi]